jgi:hypothetical protein
MRADGAEDQHRLGFARPIPCARTWAGRSVEREKSSFSIIRFYMEWEEGGGDTHPILIMEDDRVH